MAQKEPSQEIRVVMAFAISLLIIFALQPLLVRKQPPAAEQSKPAAQTAAVSPAEQANSPATKSPDEKRTENAIAATLPVVSIHTRRATAATRERRRRYWRISGSLLPISSSTLRLLINMNWPKCSANCWKKKSLLQRLGNVSRCLIKILSS